MARDIGLHVHSMADSQERAIAGVTSGCIGLGQEVTWEARHFGIRQRLTSRITQFDRPRHFRDTMVRVPLTASITTTTSNRSRDQPS
jgi:ligand-binding SRPBCC domain-containing protein